MKTYKGYVKSGECIIMVETDIGTYQLKHIVMHSPTGLTWGYLGSGPADTALSILTDCLNEDDARCLYQQFKFDFVGSWPVHNGHCIEITEQDIKQWADIQLGKPVGAIQP